MKKLSLVGILLLAFALPLMGAKYSYLVYPYERVIKLGDNQDWAKPEFDHSDWDPRGATDSIGIFWVRFKLRHDELPELFEQPGLQVVALGSYEMYWDGHLIGSSGVVGTSRETEVPGNFLVHFPIADSLIGPEDHTIALRVSNFHAEGYGANSWNIFFVEEYQLSLINDLVLTSKVFVLAGIYLMAALYYLFLFVLRHRQREVFIFSTLCFLFFGLIVMEYVKFLYPYPYHWHVYRLLTIFLLTFFISFLTPYFLAVYFRLPYQKWFAGGLVLILAIATSFWGIGTDQTNQNLGLAMWLVCMGILIYAVWQKRKAALMMLCVFTISGGLIWFYQLGYRSLLYAYDITLFISFSLLVLAMMYLLAKRAREQKEAYEASILLTSRLQNELLKKNIQPHFIMNTLTSLMGWVEESPQAGVRFIEALSAEFEIMSDIADRKLIPLEKEIAFCRRHIEIMRFRKEVDYVFEVEGILPGLMIPPATIHTIIENGITHNLPDENNRLKMVLEFRESEKARTYTVKTYGENRPTDHKRSGGAGLRYIRSRLMENYGDDWTLTSVAMSGGWKTTITLFK